jgi:hypothetical protein
MISDWTEMTRKLFGSLEARVKLPIYSVQRESIMRSSGLLII